MQQSIEKKRIYKRNIQNLIVQLCQASVNSILGISHVAKSATHPNPEKFNGYNSKLDKFFAWLNLKPQHNIDYFTRECQDTESNKLCYTLLRFERDAFAQRKPYISAKNIDFENINPFVEVLKTYFGKIDLVGMVKHELYRLYQMNKNLEMFLNTFYDYSKRAKLMILKHWIYCTRNCAINLKTGWSLLKKQKTLTIWFYCSATWMST